MSEQIKATKFKSIDEDHDFRQTQANIKQQAEDKQVTSYKNDSTNNFTLEHSYPAVAFDSVCFSVDRSKQQANFMQSLLYQMKSFCGQQTDAEQTVDILKSINLTVPYGSIFGLLGPSSCGKTTLLRCLVGLLEPTSGYIRLFCRPTEERKHSGGLCCWCSERTARGQRSVGCKVPGANVGYMPQDLGLYIDFTIRQLLTMFGQYMKMKADLIATRIQFMADFLDLPNVDRVISSLSGGQKRRVSFAIACLHMPPLIILDEPTVGVDPLLRQSIWKYLRRLADEENKTIIITTHYIEEAAQADQVALMRAGEILVQDTPQRIMKNNNSKSLEEAFLKICNNVGPNKNQAKVEEKRYKLYPQPKFNLHDNLGDGDEINIRKKLQNELQIKLNEQQVDSSIPLDKLEAFDNILNLKHNTRLDEKINRLSLVPNVVSPISKQQQQQQQQSKVIQSATERKLKLFKSGKMSLNQSSIDTINCDLDQEYSSKKKATKQTYQRRFWQKFNSYFILAYALLYKNYRRNVNSLPLIAFQFMLPIIQMISFSLCVGGRPTNIGLGLVNHDQLINLPESSELLWLSTERSPTDNNFTTELDPNSIADKLNDTISYEEELLSLKYLSFIDQSMMTIKPYDNLRDALNDVRLTKLWAVMEIGENFTTTITRRFDLDNFYQLDLGTIKQSVIKLYPDRSNKILDMICQRSLINSYRSFLLDHFEHFKKLPIEVKEPIFDIKPNLISNSIDGYTESIAAGLLASLTYIMAAGLTTFIMVVERSAGILERTYTSGINPVAYLIAHAVFRSLVMMLQIAVVTFLTFYILQQPLVGSLGLAYTMLMSLNLTGIAYGLFVSSLVTDQNGAALTIVSSLVVKITLSGILWPFEAIPYWLRTICYIQPLTMPIQALKAITLKGATLSDRSVQMGFFVSITWLLVFLTISAKRFKFYQH